MNDSNTDNFTPKTKRIRRLRLWAIALLGFILFIAGGAVGGGTSTIIILNSLQHKTHTPRWTAHKIAQRMQHRLDLTKAQTKKITRIIQTHQHNINESRRSARKKIETQLKQMRDEIIKVLTPKQRKKWEAFFDRMHKRWAPYHKPHHKRRHHRQPPPLSSPSPPSLQKQPGN